MNQRERTMKALNVVCKWRKLLAGWQLGTRLDSDPESRAIRNHREATILLRVESSAIIGILLRKGIIAEGEWLAALEQEAQALDAAYAEQFPGITASESGLHFKMPQAGETMKGWLP